MSVLQPRAGNADLSARIEPPLSQTVGYIVVVLIGMIIAFGSPPCSAIAMDPRTALTGSQS